METCLNPGLFCRRCGYPLLHLDRNRCPECGRESDPADARSFRSAPKLMWWKYLKRIIARLLLGGLVLSAPLSWTYWKWRQYQEAISVLKPLGFSVVERDCGGGWMKSVAREVRFKPK